MQGRSASHRRYYADTTVIRKKKQVLKDWNLRKILLFGFYTLLLELLRFFPGAVLAPELRFVVTRPVIVTGPYQTVSACDPPAVHAVDFLFHFPLRSKRLRCKNKLIYPEEDQSPDQVCHDRCNELPHRGEEDSHPGEDGVLACQRRR
jgi:hypothetical protein